MHEGGELPLANGLALEAELMEQLFKSKDADEGLHAFVEKRKPEFVGRMSTLTTHAGSFIAGAEHRNAGDPLDVVNPADGRPFTEVAAATAADVDAAVHAAADAFREWSQLAVSKRGEILGRAAHHVEEHIDELIPLLTREQGKTLRDSRIEITKAVDTLMHYVGLSKALRGAHTPNLDPGVDGFVLRRPLGVVGAIVPWNFPTTLLCNKLAPALVAGNTVVAKPAATTPLTTLRFAELLAEGGLPEGVFNVVTGRGSEAGEALVTHPLVRKIAFTGSTPVGERIMALRRARHQAGHARARRLGPDDHLRRRRPGRRRERREHGPLLQLRPGVPGDQARVRVRVGRRRGHRRDRREGQAAEGRPRRRQGHADGPDAHRAAVARRWPRRCRAR